jgi:hypothetical protein
VFHIGKKPHAYDNPHDNLTIQGFASDAPSTIKVFQRETELHRRAAVPGLDSAHPDVLIDHVAGLFRKAGLEQTLLDRLDQAVPLY